MLRGYYNAVQGMLVKQRELDTIGNNVANVNTAGYRKQEAVLNTFKQELILVQGRRRYSGTTQQTYVQDNHTGLENGTLDFTESKFDVGIFGNVYFNVRTPGDATWAPDFEEEREAATAGRDIYGINRDDIIDDPNYVGGWNVADDVGYQNTQGEVLLTRNGQFELDGEGYLAMNDGAGKVMRVQSEAGDIYIGTHDFAIDPDGTIRRDGRPDANNDEVIGRLALTYIPPDAPMGEVQRIGNNLLRYTGGAQMPADERFDIVQGAFERSNVDMNKEMSQVMEVQRAYEANSKVLMQLDAINKIASTIASMTG